MGNFDDQDRFSPISRRCARCVLDSTVPGICFSDEEICNHCNLFDRLGQKYALDAKNETRFERLLAKIKSKGEGKKYDCLVGLSGGTDSSYCLFMAKKLGLRPLALHFDNGWVSEVASSNVKNVVRSLGVDLRLASVSWSQLKEYYRACLRASIPELCMPCMVGIPSLLYQTAAEENISYIILGTSFKTEGMTPARWYYLDGAYFRDVMKKSGAWSRDAAEFNKIDISNLVYYTLVRRIKTIQLPLYIDYRDAEIRNTLETELDWEYGGRHHFDCSFKPFLSYVHARKFDMDLRKIPLSALVRSGEITRDQALTTLREDPIRENTEMIDNCLQRLEISPEEFEEIMSSEPKNFLAYKSDYSIYRRGRLLVKLLAKCNLLPETLYERYFTLV